MEENKQNALFSFLESSEAREAIVELETLLTAHKALAPENGGDGEMDKCMALLQYMEEKGLLSHCEVDRYDAPDERVTGGLRPNVVVTMRGGGERANAASDTGGVLQKDARADAADGAGEAGAVWVISHLDVVPVGDVLTWHTDPWQVVQKDGALYGRGVEDDQQGIVSGVLALMAFVKSSLRPCRTVKLLFASDEEVGSKYGMRYLMEHYASDASANGALFSKNDIIIIPDGGDPKGETIEVAEKGILWLEVTVTGQQAHGSRPDLGKNACLAASDLSMRLHSMEEKFNERDALFTPEYSTFSPTMRKANVDSVNIIPGKDVFCMDCRVLPCYRLEDVMQEAKKRCKAVETEYGVSVKIEVLQQESSPATATDAPVVKALSAALKASRGVNAVTIGIGGGTVAASLRLEGYDAAVWSTIEDNAHQSNERALIDNIIADAKTLAVLFG